jgi:ATP-dependent Clp protease ATP-binding subunit ClpX
MTPSQIVKYLDQHVVGQEEAKRQLAVAVYTHYKKIALAGPDKVEIIKSNVLLVGPTGTGKTLLCETLSRVLQVPFVTANATSLAQSEYVNDEIEAILLRLIDKAEGDVGRAQRGIVFIDEIDKLKAISSQQGQVRGTSGEGVQHALLKIMEGAPVKIKGAHYIDTTQILFICGGAFVGLEDIARAPAFLRFHLHLGGATTRSCSTASTPHQAHRPVRVRPDPGIRRPPADRRPLKPLSREMMVRIMTEPKNSIYKQYRQMLANDGVELVIERWCSSRSPTWPWNTRSARAACAASSRKC